MNETSLKRGIARILLYLFLIVGAIISTLPFIWMVSSSLKEYGEIFLYPPTLIPEQIMWTNYSDVLSAIPFGRFFMNSVVVAVSVTGGVLLTSSLAGYAFARLDFPTEKLSFFCT